MSAKVLVGKISHFRNETKVALIDLVDTLEVGDRISIEGSNKKTEQKVREIEFENISVRRGFKGNSVEVELDEPVEEGSEVYRFV
jgi:hypothetical protein